MLKIYYLSLNLWQFVTSFSILKTLVFHISQMSATFLDWTTLIPAILVTFHIKVQNKLKVEHKCYANKCFLQGK